jgi:hypothetical protein
MVKLPFLIIDKYLNPDSALNLATKLNYSIKARAYGLLESVIGFEEKHGYRRFLTQNLGLN